MRRLGKKKRKNYRDAETLNKLAPAWLLLIDAIHLLSVSRSSEMAAQATGCARLFAFKFRINAVHILRNQTRLPIFSEIQIWTAKKVCYYSVYLASSYLIHFFIYVRDKNMFVICVLICF